LPRRACRRSGGNELCRAPRTAEQEVKVERLVLIASLKPGAEAAAAELIAGGPPFDLERTGFERHAIYLSSGEVVFVFEGHEVEWAVDALVDAPFNWMLSDALERWRLVIEDTPRVARQRFSWERFPDGEDHTRPRADGSV
jgi:hypothetical protein